MSLISAKIAKFKILENIELQIDGRNVYLLGENGKGKTSFQQAIRFLCGDDTCIPAFGDAEAEAVLEIKGKRYAVKGKVKDGKRAISFSGEDGMTSTSVKLLAQLTSCATLDVDGLIRLGATRAGREKQIEILKNILPPAAREEIAKIEARHAQTYKDRTDINRQALHLDGSLKTSTQKTEVPEPEDASQISEKISDAEKNNSEIESIKVKKQDALAHLFTLKSEIEEMENKIQSHKQRISTGETVIETYEQDLTEKKYIDVEPLKIQIKEHKQKQVQYSEWINYSKESQKRIELIKKSDMLTKNLDCFDSEIKKLITENNKNISGLEIKRREDGEQYLTYKNIAVDENSLSTAEQIELSYKLTMASNPDCDILFVERTESMGIEKMKMLHEVAAKNNKQLITEKVVPGSELEFRFESENV